MWLLASVAFMTREERGSSGRALKLRRDRALRVRVGVEAAMARLDVKIDDFKTGKVRVVTYRGPTDALLLLRREIRRDRAAHKPPGTAIHTPVPADVAPGGFVASFLVLDPLEVIEE
jgi:hypothetical protein